MPNTRDHVLSPDNIKLLLISRPGRGKTIAAGSWYKAGTIFIADFDGRTKPLRWAFPEADIPYKSYKDFESFRDDFLMLASGGRIHIDDGTLDGIDYEDTPNTIIFDGLTFFSLSLMQYLLSYRNPAKQDAHDKDGNARRMGIVEVPGWPEYQGEALGMSQVLDIARTIKSNFIMTAHETESLDLKQGQGKSITVAKKSVIAIGQKVPQIIPGFFDEIWYMYTRDGINQGENRQFVVHPTAAEDMGKTVLPLPEEFDITLPRTMYEEVKKFCEKGESR